MCLKGRKILVKVNTVNNIIIDLFILGLKTSNNLQQSKYKNDTKQYFTEMLKIIKESKPKI